VIPATPLDVIERRAPWALVHGSCVDPDVGLAKLPDDSCDHVITDPPYSEHTHQKQRSGSSTVRLNGSDHRIRRISVERDLGFAHLTAPLSYAIALHAARVARRWFVAFSDAESLELWLPSVRGAGLEHVRVGAWLKPDAQPQFTGDRPGNGFEIIEIAHRPNARKRWNGGGRHAVWPCNIVKHERLHTTQKPLALMESLIRDFTEPGEIVVDPFAGSATTGIACIRLGRRFIGWEVDDAFHGVALKRLGEAREQHDLLDGEAFRREAKRKRPQLGLTLDEPFTEE
jgi:hypothetical protein